jgi:hypothetical protein
MAKLTDMSNVGVIVTGVLVGSASGVVGTVLGAWISGRSQRAVLKVNIEAENSRARFADKRAIYAQCLAALDTCHHSLERLRRLRGASGFAVAADQYDGAWQDCSAKVNELGLVAPDEVRFVALTASSRLYRLAELVESSQEQFRNTEVKYFEAVDCLREALRADLGMPPGLDLETMIQGLSPDDQEDRPIEVTQPAEG